MKKLFKFSAQASRDEFLKDLTIDKYVVLSDKEIEVIIAEDEMEEEGPKNEEMCKKCELQAAMSYMQQELSYMYKYMNSEMNYVYSMFNQHMAGHLPPISSAEQMKTAIGKLGLGEEYDVQKRVVYASTIDKKGDLLLELK